MKFCGGQINLVVSAQQSCECLGDDGMLIWEATDASHPVLFKDVALPNIQRSHSYPGGRRPEDGGGRAGGEDKYERGT